MSAGCNIESGTTPGASLEGAKAVGLGGRDDHIPDGIVAGDAVTIATTPDLMVTKGVRSTMAFGAGKWDAVKRGP